MRASGPSLFHDAYASVARPAAACCCICTIAAVAVAANPISAPSQPISIASRMNVSLPVSTPILRGAAAASSMLARVLSTLNEASLMATTPSIFDSAVIAPRG
jgi:hypothetical protein